MRPENTAVNSVKLVRSEAEIYYEHSAMSIGLQNVQGPLIIRV
jgi:hypothetical protein